MSVLWFVFAFVICFATPFIVVAFLNWLFYCEWNSEQTEHEFYEFDESPLKPDETANDYLLRSALLRQKCEAMMNGYIFDAAKQEARNRPFRYQRQCMELYSSEAHDQQPERPRSEHQVDQAG